MGSFSIWHWVIMGTVIAMRASPILGVIRGVKNGAVIHAVVSTFVPMYGLIYFLATIRGIPSPRSEAASAPT
jgi:hypothetical protein